MTTALRSDITSGMLAWTARNHSGENFRQCSRQAPSGTFTRKDVAPTAPNLAMSGFGRSALTCRIEQDTSVREANGAGVTGQPKVGYQEALRVRILLHRHGEPIGKRRTGGVRASAARMATIGAGQSSLKPLIFTGSHETMALTT